MPTTTVLMATYNGTSFLERQIRSIASQSSGQINLLVSDDGSSDDTLEILARAEAQWQKGTITTIKGPKKGFAENYRFLIGQSPKDSDLYAFSDQDDEWEIDKLVDAAEWLETKGDQPALSCCRTLTIDEEGREVGYSPLFSTLPSFRNAIVQSIAGGNTMVFNRPARDLLVEACERTGFVSHDWWAYLLVTGAGGVVRYSKVPKVRYRQHESNLVGANSSWRARMMRLALMAGGRFTDWNERNTKALTACEDLLTADARSVLDEFKIIRSSKLPGRLIRLKRSGIHRQTALGQMSLYAAGVLGKI